MFELYNCHQIDKAWFMNFGEKINFIIYKTNK
jgi:hypothetical protein